MDVLLIPQNAYAGLENARVALLLLAIYIVRLRESYGWLYLTGETAVSNRLSGYSSIHPTFIKHEPVLRRQIVTVSDVPHHTVFLGKQSQQTVTISFAFKKPLKTSQKR